MSILEQLRAAKIFTPSEEALAAFILSNPNKAFRLTLRELAESSFVSKPTIIRLYRKIGFESYSDFRIAYFSETRGDSKEVLDFNLPFRKNESVIDIATSICNLTKQIVDNNLKALDQDNLNQIVNVLFESNRIFLFAIGDSMIQAQAFHNKLVKLDIYTYLINEFGDTLANIYNMEEDDCILVISFSGITFQDNDRSVRAIAQSKAKSIILSSMNPRDIPFQFDYYMRLVGEEDRFEKIGTFSSQIAINYALNLLYSCIYEKEYENNRKYNQKYVTFINNVYK